MCVCVCVCGGEGGWESAYVGCAFVRAYVCIYEQGTVRRHRN